MTKSLGVLTLDVVAKTGSFTAGMDKAERASKKMEAEYRRLKKSIDPAFQSQERITKSTAILKRELDRGAISLEQYSADMQRLNTTTKAANDSVVTGQRSYRSAGMVIQQAGYQVQDFTVQVAGGQNAMLALAQQGSQLAGIFGPGGAVIGAFLAIAAVAGMVFLPSIFKSTDALKDLEKAIEDISEIAVTSENNIQLLSDELERLYRLSKSAALAEINSKLIKTREALEKSKEGVERLADTATSSFMSVANAWDLIGVEDAGARFSAAVDGVRRTLDLTEDQAESLVVAFRKFGQNRDLTQLSRSIDELFITVSDPNDKLVAIRDKLFQMGEASRKAEEKIKFLENSIKDLDSAVATSSEPAVAMIDDIADIEKQLAEKFAKIHEKRAEEAEKLAADIANIEDQAGMVFARIHEKNTAEAEAAAQRRVAIEQFSNQMVLSARMGFAQQLGAIIAQGAEENSTAAKIGYATSQAVQVAQAINNANLSYTGIIAAASSIPDPTGATLAAGISRAEVIRNLGYATAGLIAGNAIGNVLGSGHDGWDSIPETGSWYLKKGERVSTAETSAKMDATLERVNRGLRDNSRSNWQVNINNYGEPMNGRVTNVDYRKQMIDIMVEQNRDPASRPRQALQSTSNVTARGTR